MLCDSHVHVVGGIERYPQLATRAYLAGPASLAELRRHASSRGVARFVIVQPSFYGTDNSLLLATLDDLRSEGRGVAVIDPTVATNDLLADCAARGVRGLRVNLYSKLGEQNKSLASSFAALEDIARAMAWHVEVIAPLGILLEQVDLLARARVDVVIDHYGLYGSLTADSAEGRELLALLGNPHIWMKLSAPYRVSGNPLQTAPDKAWLSAILAIAAPRCVWGSDWPHTPPHDAQKGPMVLGQYRDLSYEALVDDFLAAVDSVALAEQIMRDNPARLYGF
jgi:predicted TIM-barrel fold metal-dependent hydrolase